MWQLQFTTLCDSMTPTQPSRPQVSPSQYPSSLMFVCSIGNRIGRRQARVTKPTVKGGLAPADAVELKGRGCRGRALPRQLAWRGPIQRRSSFTLSAREGTSTGASVTAPIAGRYSASGCDLVAGLTRATSILHGWRAKPQRQLSSRAVSTPPSVHMAFTQPLAPSRMTALGLTLLHRLPDHTPMQPAMGSRTSGS